MNRNDTDYIKLTIFVIEVMVSEAENKAKEYCDELVRVGEFNKETEKESFEFIVDANKQILHTFRNSYKKKDQGNVEEYTRFQIGDLICMDIDYKEKGIYEGEGALAIVTQIREYDQWQFVKVIWMGEEKRRDETPWIIANIFRRA